MTCNSQEVEQHVVCSPETICFTVPNLEQDETEKRVEIQVLFKDKPIHTTNLELIVNVEAIPDIQILVNDSSPLLLIQENVKKRLSHNYIKRY